jgi:polyferredoxin
MTIKFHFNAPIILALFLAIGVILSLALHNAFYLANFGYIGGCLALATHLQAKGKAGRLVAQMGIGLYMLVFLGFIMHENMQLEGFWFYLFNGIFAGSVIHYLVAKIGGPLIFGRGFCGYACWTAAFLDILPYKIGPRQRLKGLSVVRYLLFALSLFFVLGLLYFKVDNSQKILFVAFIGGNLIYYAVGITLAFVLRDNRAFCKYICPITIFLKVSSYFALLRIKVDKKKCTNCGQCIKICPMNVELLNPKRSRVNGTECILCQNCLKVCPHHAITL